MPSITKSTFSLKKATSPDPARRRLDVWRRDFDVPARKVGPASIVGAGTDQCVGAVSAVAPFSFEDKRADVDAIVLAVVLAGQRQLRPSPRSHTTASAARSPGTTWPPENSW